MTGEGRALSALVVAAAALALVSATGGGYQAAAHRRPPGGAGAPTPPSPATCRQCCLQTGRRCHHTCPPCNPIVPDPVPTGQCPIEADLLNLDSVRCGRGGCSGDSDCVGKQKCCRHGRCGHHCTPACFPPCGAGQQCRIDSRPPACLGAFCPPASPAVTASCHPDPDLPQPGLAQCPDADPNLACPYLPRDQCRSDVDCGIDGRQRCCSDGCRRRCIPTCSPPCSAGRSCKLRVHRAMDCAEPHCPPPVETASCELAPDANPCAAILCRVGTRCEVRNGVGICVPVGDIGRVCPKFERTALCLILDNKCSSDSECGPLEKCCEQNCGRECVSSCRACGPGEECVLEHFATCQAIGCPPAPPPRATCRPVNPTIGPPTSDPIRQGQCPRDTLITTCEVKADACYSDSQCPEGERCCSRGCGRACTPVCQNCDGPLRQCVLQQVQCIRAPCPPLAFCQRLPAY